MVGLLTISVWVASTAQGQWMQWGGPTRDFHTQGISLSTTWPPDGPRRIWSRDLGPGSSAVMAGRDRVVTTYRRGDDEVVVVLDAHDGKTIWEHGVAASLPSGFDPAFGRAPTATPRLTDTRVYVFGLGGAFSAYNLTSGELLWTRDIAKDTGITLPAYGVRSGPVAWKDRFMFSTGSADGSGQAGVIVYHARSGTFLWQGVPAKPVYAPPITMDLDGGEQFVFQSPDGVVGIHPLQKFVVWQFDHPAAAAPTSASPVWVRSSATLVIPSESAAGSAAIRLNGDAGSTQPELLWKNPRLRLGPAPAVSDGGLIFGSGPSDSGAVFSAARLSTGEIVWQDTSFAPAAVIVVDGKLLILDDSGTLALATPGPTSLTVHARAKILEGPCHAPPTLVEKRVYIRDDQRVVALDLN